MPAVSGERARGEEGGHAGGRVAMSAGGRRMEQVRFKRKLERAEDKVSPNHFGPNGKSIFLGQTERALSK